MPGPGPRGYAVSVICPRGPGDARRQHLDGVDLYKYSPPPEARGFLSYAWEFAYCWVRTAVLSLVAYRAADHCKSTNYTRH